MPVRRLGGQRFPHRPTDPLPPYGQLIDLCDEKGWTTHLDYEKRGWVLSVRDHGDLIARGVSRKKRPLCFVEVANHAIAGLVLARRL